MIGVSSKRGAQVIANMLAVNNSVTSDLARNAIGRIGDAGAQAIVNVLVVNNSVTSIDLGGNRIGDVGAQAIANMLEVNKSVTSINLAGNYLGDTGSKAIADAIKSNPVAFTTLASNQKLALVTARNVKHIPILYRTPVNIIRRILTRYRVNPKKEFGAITK